MRIFRLLAALLVLSIGAPAPAIVISEVMHHPAGDESRYEWVEIYNEKPGRRDLSHWQFTDGIHYTFPAGTTIEPRAYLVIAIDPATIANDYGITNVVGPYTGRLDNNSDHIILRDNSGGVIAEVDYQDDGKWPVAADGAGHSLTKFKMRGDPMDADNWRQSPEMGGSPGRDNGFLAWNEDADIIATDEVWRYFKGVTEASAPIDAWRQVGFDDTVAGWLSGPTGIGYGDGDDATILGDMRNSYVSVFCRKTFTVADPAAIDRLILEVDHDDGFVAYLNGVELLPRGSMPTGTIFYNTSANLHAASVEGGAITSYDLTSQKGLLLPGVNANVLAVQVHNAGIGSSDLSFIPRLVSRVIHDPGALSTSLVINEVYFNGPGEQYIELHNVTGAPIDAGGYYLSNVPTSLTLHQLAAPRIVPAGGQLAIPASEFGFAINPLGDQILLTNPAADYVVSACAVEPGPVAGASTGRYPDGAEDWYNMALTAGAPNVVALETDVVINEIMYQAPTGNPDHDFIELTNIGAAAVDLTGWRLTRGIDFDFAPGTSIAAGQFLAIAKNRTALIAHHGLDPAIVLGNYTGELANRDENIRLRDANDNIADEVHYYEGGRWSKYADGYGSSLELIDPRQDNGNPQAWAPSDETGQAQWQFISYSGRVQTETDPTRYHLHELHLRMMGPSEVLIDDVHLTYNSNEYIGNGSFESGLGSWLPTGTHQETRVEPAADAPNGANVLRIVAVTRGDTGPNHIETDSQVPMPDNVDYNLSFWVKWQWGNRVLVTGCWDHQLLETHMLDVPQVTGTPGAQNSVYQANLGPVFSNVAHSPVVPAPADTPTISARVYDPNNVSNVTLSYKSDSDGAYATAPMFDDGAHNDGAAGDGVYGAAVPAYANGQNVAFYITAQDGASATNTWPTDITRPGLYRVENSPLTHNFATYRIILTAADDGLLFSRPHLSNYPLNCTFIFNETDIYYNCGTRFIGSPFHRSGGGYNGYKIKFNADEKLHGQRTQVRVDNNPGGAYHDRLSYDLQRWMGLPHCLLEYVYVKRNGQTNGTLEDTIHPGARYYLNAFYPDDDSGQLFEVNDRFRFTNVDDLLYNFNNFNADFNWQGWDPDPYRDYFYLRNHDNEDDHTSLVLLMDQMNNVSPTPSGTYEDAIRQVINVEQWFQLMAIRATIADWDFIGGNRGKNCYLYYPAVRGKWDLLGWDSELTFSDTNMSLWSGFADIRRFQQSPRHQHFYYHYIHELLTNYFNNANMDPWIDYYVSLVGGSGAEKSFISARVPILMAQMPAAPPCAVTTNGGNPFTAPGFSTVLQGTAPVQVRWVRVDGVEYYLDWTAATRWIYTQPISYGLNNLSLEFLDYNRNIVCTDAIAITGPPPPPEWFLRVTELHYNPEQPSYAERQAGFTDSDEFEFIELTNTSALDTLDLTGIQFTIGIQVDLTTATVTALAPGRRVALARNPAAFAFRYGASPTPVGTYGGALDNGGEPLQFQDAGGQVIQSFTYDDEGAWPPEADGYGPPLEAIDTAGDYNDPYNWRAAPINGGTPGTPPIVPAMTPEREFLRITEMHYHPLDPSVGEVQAGFSDEGEFEFVELMNLSSTATLSLIGVRFTGGIFADMTTGSINSILPGEGVLLVSNIAAFEFRYGTGHPLAGQYEGRFSNGGEVVRLVDSLNAPIHHYLYDDAAPWATAADGFGPALEVIDVGGDYNSWSNWSASIVIGGTPYKPGVLPPTILDQPDDVRVNPGQAATFAIFAADADSYQWKRAPNLTLANGGDISGADTPSLQIANCADADEGEYFCEATNAGGTRVSSRGTLTVNDRPAVTAGGPFSLAAGAAQAFTIATVVDDEANPADLAAVVTNLQGLIFSNVRVDAGGAVSATIDAGALANGTMVNGVVVTVTDTGGLARSDTFTVTIDAGNTNPSLVGVDVKTPALERGRTVLNVVVANVSDTEDAPGQLTVTVANNPTVLTFGAFTVDAAGVVRTSVTAPLGAPVGESATITLQVEDSGGLTGIGRFTVEVHDFLLLRTSRRNWILFY